MRFWPYNGMIFKRLMKKGKLTTKKGMRQVQNCQQNFINQQLKMMIFQRGSLSISQKNFWKRKKKQKKLKQKVKQKIQQLGCQEDVIAEFFDSVDQTLLQKIYNFYCKSILMKKGGPSNVTKSSGFNAKAFVKPGMSEEEVKQIKDAFDLFDTEGSGSIDPKQLKSSLQSMGFEAKNQSIYQLICDLEADGAGYIDFNTFLHLMTTKVSASDSREEIRKVFALFDDEKSGYVSVSSLRRICKELGENLQEFELQDMIFRADKDKDGFVSEQEFYQILTGKE